MQRATTAFLACLIITVLFVQQSHAAKTVTFTTQINQGSLLTDIRDNLGRSIARPILDFGRVVNDIDCRTDNGLQATLGSDNQRLYVDNPKAAYDGWSLTIAPLEGASAVWQSENHSFDFNDPGESGCLDSDGDKAAGLMSIDPSQASISADCLECGQEHITTGSKQEVSFAEQGSITLLRANSSADELGRWYMTGVEVSQTIPPGQDGDNYRLDMVLTATAN